MTIYVVEMNEWGCGLYGGVGNLLTFISLCDKNAGVRGPPLVSKILSGASGGGETNKTQGKTCIMATQNVVMM